MLSFGFYLLPSNGSILYKSEFNIFKPMQNQCKLDADILKSFIYKKERQRIAMN